MKLKYIAILSSICVLPITSPAMASTIIQTGKHCSSINKSVISENLKFICIKSGKKLVWGKGIKVTPIDNPIPTPSPTSSKNHKSGVATEGTKCPPNSADVIGYDKNWNYVDLMCNSYDDQYITRPENLNPFKVDPLTGVALRIIPKDLLTDDGSGNINILTSAIKQVSLYSSKKSAPKLIEYIDPAYPLDFIQKSETSAKALLSAYSDRFTNTDTYYLIYATTKDFAMSSYQDVALKEKNQDILNPNGNVIPGLNANLISGDGEKFSGGAITSGFINARFQMTTFFYNPNNSKDNAFMTPGEMKHGLFDALANAHQLSPCFMTPGNLDLFGAAFGIPNETLGEKVFRFATTGGSLRQASQYTLFNSLDLSLLDGRNHSPADGTECGAMGDYVIAPIGVAYLVGKYGIDKELDFVAAFGKDPNNWQTVFQTIYGFSLESFYAEAHPFMVWYKAWFLSHNLTAQYS